MVASAAATSNRHTKLATKEFVHALSFFGIGRVKANDSKAVTLAAYYNTEVEDQLKTVNGIFKKLLNVAEKSLTRAQKIKLPWRGSIVYCMLDNEGTLLYCLITSEQDYPDRYAYHLLTHLHQHVQSLPDPFRPDSKEHGLDAHLQGPISELNAKNESPEPKEQRRNAESAARQLEAKHTDEQEIDESIRDHQQQTEDLSCGHQQQSDQMLGGHASLQGQVEAARCSKNMVQMAQGTSMFVACTRAKRFDDLCHPPEKNEEEEKVEISAAY